jgi:nucleotide-binding universal stress UspA family protein
MKILHPTDFSTSADEALAFAVRLVRGLGGEIILVHVVPEHLVDEPLMVGTQDLTKVSEARRRWSEEALEKRAASLRGDGLRVRWRLAVGVDHEAIVKLAAEETADLIVMGTHGRGGLRKMFLGNVTDRVVRTATSPVLTVREPAGGSA